MIVAKGWNRHVCGRLSSWVAWVVESCSFLSIHLQNDKHASQCVKHAIDWVWKIKINGGKMTSLSNKIATLINWFSTNPRRPRILTNRKIQSFSTYQKSPEISTNQKRQMFSTNSKPLTICAVALVPGAHFRDRARASVLAHVVLVRAEIARFLAPIAIKRYICGKGDKRSFSTYSCVLKMNLAPSENLCCLKQNNLIWISFQ